MPPEPTRRRQAAATRGSLIEIGRELFAERGYAATSVDAVQSRAGLTRGGFYHHFGGKRELFRAVVEQIDRELLAWVSAADRTAAGPWERLRAACLLLLSACLDPGVRRIMLVDGPAVLPPDALEASRVAALRARLEPALAEDPGSAGPLAHLLLGALNSAAQLLAHCEDRRGAWSELHSSVTLVLEGLRLAYLQGIVPSVHTSFGWEGNPWEAWRKRAAATERS